MSIHPNKLILEHFKITLQKNAGFIIFDIAADVLRVIFLPMGLRKRAGLNASYALQVKLLYY